jgi:hypothetical protein
MDKNICSSTIWFNKAITFFVAKPFYFALHF